MPDHAPPPLPCLIVTATIAVKDDMSHTVIRDPRVRHEEYKGVLRKWMSTPGDFPIVFVENSGFDLSELRAIASESRQHPVEFLSFHCPPFDGNLGKGYGEMFCLEHCLEHSETLRSATRFVKVTGRYYLKNARAFMAYVAMRVDADVVCNLLVNLTWGDSRAFGGKVSFLAEYLVPRKHLVDDSKQTAFEHVLARAGHAAMADGGMCGVPPMPLRIEGSSASQGHRRRPSLKRQIAQLLRQKLFVRTLTTYPE